MRNSASDNTDSGESSGLNGAAAIDFSAAGFGLRPLLQLLRLPNVFTAIADVLMGFLVVRGGIDELDRFIPLLLSSICLYLAGMVLNDLFDVEQDRKERPYRPLPSGRISLGFARKLGLGLLLAGMLCGWLACLPIASVRPGIIATLLAACVWAYDGVLKRTPLAPVAMGACRMLNVLLGMSADPLPWTAFNWLLAAGLGIYIVGVTWFARTEARPGSSQIQLAFATAVALCGIILLGRTPILVGGIWNMPLPLQKWNLLWTTLGVLIGWRMVRAAFEPTPEVVQPAVKVAILSIIMLDAAVCLGKLGYAGPLGVPWVLVMLLLLAPAMFLGRWIYST